MIVIYRKSDLACVGNVIEPMTFNQEMELNVIPNFGGSTEDYDVIETGMGNFHLELIEEVVTPVKNKELEQPPTIEEYMVDLDFRLSNIELGL